MVLDTSWISLASYVRSPATLFTQGPVGEYCYCARKRTAVCSIRRLRSLNLALQHCLGPHAGQDLTVSSCSQANNSHISSVHGWQLREAVLLHVPTVECIHMVWNPRLRMQLQSIESKTLSLSPAAAIAFACAPQFRMVSWLTQYRHLLAIKERGRRLFAPQLRSGNGCLQRLTTSSTNYTAALLVSGDTATLAPRSAWIICPP
uniref:Uncharacterized protein n=1 Tax=Spironucleus salmonicida TaxID=348837 RepID=V6LTM2_9EUKA|eukprot:EST47935.1 Hypothetical protein SS50377_11954 [Spironucleus salmonicida]